MTYSIGMPAVLDEAYVSPFDRVLGGPRKDQSSDTGSSDIRAGPYGISGGRSEPYQRDYRVSQAQSMQSVQPTASMSDMASVYNTLPTLSNTGPLESMHQGQQYPTAHIKSRTHNCNDLIDQIMSCRECRQKLRAILIKERMDELRASAGSGAETETEAKAETEGEQTGGGLGFGLDGLLNDQGFLVNFIIGIAVLFLLDRIIKLKTA